jgi:hypothetical protein
MKSLIFTIATLIFFTTFTQAQTELFFHNPTTSGNDNSVGYTALYENVATFNDQIIEMKATIVDASDSDDISSFGFASDSGHDFRFNMRDDRVSTGDSIWAKVKFQFFYAGTHTPANMTIDFTHDNITENTKSIDKVQVEAEEIAAYTINDPTTLDIQGTFTFAGTEHSGNNNNPEYAVIFHYENANTFYITYKMIKKSNNSTTIFYRADGNGELVEFNNQVRINNFFFLLPLDLIDFSVELENQEAMISWITENEEALSHFEIERSTDGIKFETINMIPAKGNNGDLTYYDAIDTKPNSGVNYYRLRSVDFDGTYYYSDIEVIEIKETNITTVQVYPNPTTDWIKVNAETTVETINIMDMNGRTIINTTVQDSFGEVNVSDLPKGQYFININFEGGEFTNQAIIVQ